MMHTDMLLLAERLVIAMESLSHDVKNMSAYVYDMSCSVSYLVNERREKESISVEACDDGEGPTSATCEEYEQADERQSYMEQEHGSDAFGDIATTSIENSGFLSSENNSVFTGGIKAEEQAEVEVNDESQDEHNIYRIGRNNVGDHSAFVFQLPEGQTSVAGTSQMQSAKDNLMALKRVDSEERAHKCSMCRKSFKFQSLLVRHIRVHTGEKPYECNVCGKAFSRDDNLTLHMFTHNSECPYKCEVCGKAFARSSYLTSHMRCHTGERPFKCTICEKAFSLSSTLRDHMGTHTDEKQYRCTLCGMSFGHRRTLCKHVLTHTGENHNEGVRLLG